MYKEKFMKLAIKEAIKAEKVDEIPVGAVIVLDDKVIARAYNKKESSKRALNHAEVIAINKACKKIDNWRLDNCDIYITLEPCPMCASLIHQSRISNVYFGIANKNEKISAINSQIYSDNVNNVITNSYGNVMSNECYELLSNFFKKKRNM